MDTQDFSRRGDEQQSGYNQIRDLQLEKRNNEKRLFLQQRIKEAQEAKTEIEEFIRDETRKYNKAVEAFEAMRARSESSLRPHLLANSEALGIWLSGLGVDPNQDYDDIWTRFNAEYGDVSDFIYKPPSYFSKSLEDAKAMSRF